jgi:hypothetical protein
MSYAKKASDDQIMRLYADTQSCKKVARALGMCPQSVHERLAKMGKANHVNVLTEADNEAIRQTYESGISIGDGKLDALAMQIGRSKHLICRRARELGLTRQGRPRTQSYCAELSRAQSEWIKKNGHPRGALGMKHAPETIVIISKKSKQAWDSMTKTERSDHIMKSLKGRAVNGWKSNRKGCTWKQGWRVIGGTRKFYRSKWEANYARYLEFLRQRGQIQSWQHEPETFWFEKIRRGSRSYLPDFRVVERGGAVVYHEVKGWMDSKSKTKLRRMGLYHPSVKMVLVQQKQYTEIKNKLSGAIEGWES